MRLSQPSDHDATLNDLQDYDFEMIKSHELELENQKLREDLNRLRCLTEECTIDENLLSKEIIEQFNALNEEVQRRRDECIQLKSLLVNKTRSFNNMLNPKDNIEDIVNDGNEFEMAYNTQKILNRMLTDQLQEAQRGFEAEKAQLLKEIGTLKVDNAKQHEILMENLPPESLAEATFKYELDRINDENAELRAKCDHLAEEAKKYKKVLKVYIRRSKLSKLY